MSSQSTPAPLPTESTDTNPSAPTDTNPTPPDTQQTTNQSPPSRSPSPPSELDTLPHLKSWLTSTHSKIEQFWIGATWRLWARYELYLFLDSALSDSCLLNHGISEIFDPHDEQVDILIEPLNSDLAQVAVILRCENVNENEGSFERFRGEMDRDIERIQGLAGEGVNGMWEGTKVVVVGLSGPKTESEDAEWRGVEKPVLVGVEGEVSMWVWEVVLAGRGGG